MRKRTLRALGAGLALGLLGAGGAAAADGLDSPFVYHPEWGDYIAVGAQREDLATQLLYERRQARKREDALRRQIRIARRAVRDVLRAGRGEPFEHLRRIAPCESDGIPALRDGPYFGRWQFDLATWRSVGGSGNPAEAPAAEQDARAVLLYLDRGWQPWPVCGRRVR